MKKAVIKNIIIGIISQLFAILYGFCIPILIIKTYGSEVNGLVSSIAQFISYISLLQLGIGPIIKHALFEPIVKKDKKMIGKILGASNQFFRKIAYILVMYIVILIIIFPIIKNSLDPIF